MTTIPAGPQAIIARNNQARVGQTEARRVLATVLGCRADTALAALRFSAATTCAPVARVVEQALAEAKRHHGVSADRLALTGYVVDDGESVTRVRRQAHGRADWITTTTTSVQVELSPTPAVIATDDVVRDALTEVIDPDLGVNVVDLGFVYGIAIDVDGAASLKMTLTSPACPLTKIMEDQIQTALVSSGLVRSVAVNWVFSPVWSPALISDDGRDQLRAIGFSL